MTIQGNNQADDQSGVANDAVNVEETSKMDVNQLLGDNDAVRQRRDEYLRQRDEEQRARAAARELARSEASKADPERVKAEAADAKAAAVQKTMRESQSASLVELLNRDVSWASFKDVLNYEIPSPFTSNHNADLADVALSEGWVTPAELENLKRHQEALGDSFGTILVERGMITEAQLAEAQAYKKRTGQPLWRTLMQLKMVGPEQIAEVLHSDLALPFGSLPNTPFHVYLMDHGVVQRDKLEQAWVAARDKKVEFKRYLRERKLLTDKQIAEALAFTLETPYESLDDVVEIPPRLLRLVPASVLLRHQALPYKVEGKKLYVAFAEEHNLKDMQTLGLLLDYELAPVIAPRDRLQVLINTFLPRDKSDLAVGSEAELQELEEAGHMLSAVDLLNVVLRGLVRSTATDIHFEPQRDSVRIRYRVDGLLHDVMSVNPIVGRKLSTRIQTLANMYVGQAQLPLDGHLTIDVDGQELQFRIATVPGVHGVKLAMRKVQTDLAFCNFETLGMTVEHRRLLSEILDSSNGLVLTTGPVGSGKTTTLYACLNVMDCFVHNVMTIEDPVEFDVAGVTQIQVNTKQGFTFSIGLRALLRQDPDVLMIGEIRDDETAEIAVRAAMTGQLVLSTLHANSAPAAVNALLHLKIRPFLLASALRGIVFSRLVRRICTHCSESYEADLPTKLEIGIDPKETLVLKRGKGCSHCFNTGYHGRTGVYELLKVGDAFREAVASHSPPSELEATALRDGMLRLSDHAMQLVRDGVTTVDEMQRIL